jgi:uncharacterized protein (DUF58 family)
MRPHTQLTLVAAGLGVAGLAEALTLFPQTLWIALAAVAIVLSVLDGIALRLEPKPVVHRLMPGSMALGVNTSINLEVENPTHRRRQVELHDVHPIKAEASGLPLQTVLPGKSVSQWQYRLRPLNRGDQRFGAVHCTIRSPLGFWWQRVDTAQAAVVRIYPNFEAISRYALLAMEDRLSDIGVRKRRRRGAGSEFLQLREFRQGDSLRQVDWRATARTRKLISREYQDERDQTVIFMLDSGRRMRAQDGALSHFDEALNAVLMLAYVALNRGDAVGMATFGGQSRWFPPVKGAAAISRLLNELYDLEPSTSTPDFGRAAVELLARHQKHALVIIVTNLRDEDSDDMHGAIRTLKRRHSVLLASTRESSVDRAMDAPIRGFNDALKVAASHYYRDSRTRYLNLLRNTGVACVDVVPEALSVELVNTYLAMKARGAV